MIYSPRVLSLRTEAEALAELDRIKVDPEGGQRMAGKMVRRLVKLNQVPCKAANILKQEMLALGGDAAVARGSVACSIPATDVVLIGSAKKLRKLCQRLKTQPFGLKDLAEALKQVLTYLDCPPSELRGRDLCLKLDHPRIMGVLNITPDSFSDGGCFFDRDAALTQARHLVEEGADLLDIGGESTRPGAATVSLQEELDRVVPVIEELATELAVPLSVDTTKAEVAREALSAGAHFINDISGLTFDPAMAAVVAETEAGLFLMHTRGRPDRMLDDTTYGDLVGEVTDTLSDSLAAAQAAGVSWERLAVDPGIGFGKDTTGNLELLRRISELHSLGRPILLGTSRKRFIGAVLDQDNPLDRLNGTLATVAHGVTQGVQIFRVHDVRAAREVATMTSALVGKSLD